MLEASEIRELLVRIGEPDDEKSFRKTVVELSKMSALDKMRKSQKLLRHQSLKSWGISSLKSAFRLLSMRNDVQQNVDLATVAVTKKQFNSWCMRRSTTLVQNAADVLLEPPNRKRIGGFVKSSG